MTPYYDQDGITIYHADCADVLPLVEPSTVALVLTDPPYGIGYVDPFGVAIVGDDRPFDPMPLLRYRRAVIWGADNFAHLLPPSRGWIVWSKIQSQSMINGDSRMASSPVELAWSNVASNPQLFNHFWAGGYFHRGSERGLNYHPTQKPAALMRWVLDRWSQPGDLILDPYMGSGPVAQACHEMGRRYIGIEIMEEYCEIAVQRLAQQVIPLDVLIETATARNPASPSWNTDVAS